MSTNYNVGLSESERIAYLGYYGKYETKFGTYSGFVTPVGRSTVKVQSGNAPLLNLISIPASVLAA